MNYLEAIIAKQPDERPAEWQWQQAKMTRFSGAKSLYGFQQEALEIALKGLWLYYGDDGEPGSGLRRLYSTEGAKDLLEGFDVNRMGFWMATGSGKTLVIVKIIEMLGLLMERRQIPRHDIMFLVYRDNLLQQFRRHVEEHNAEAPEVAINLVDLGRYNATKAAGREILTRKTVNVFHYRADLFFEKRTAKKLNPKSVDNNGNWYVLLDEAHRGDSRDSKLQQIYSHFARNGFLFNFSATFIDDIDRATCAYNFNLQKFISEGYGKQLYVSKENVEGFARATPFSELEKQKIVLKTLMLQTHIKTCLKAVRKADASLYHNPLLLGIVNSVTEKGSDLRMFFAELEKIAAGKVADDVFASAKQELADEMKKATYLFAGERVPLDGNRLSKISMKDILREVFNAKTHGQVEVIRPPRNNQELVFKLKTSPLPFALIRIGNVTKWVREILQGYHMTERWEDASIFEGLDSDDSSINILLGSRTFYEGWDSNRPNIILFVNIGVTKEARKFVLQAAGRGVRIEPVKHHRKRLQSLRADGAFKDEALYTAIQAQAQVLETLFIYGTNAENLKSIIQSLRTEGAGKVFDLGEEFAINPEAEKRLLLVPVYRLADGFYAERQSKFPISQADLDCAKAFLSGLSEKVLLMKHDCSLATLRKARAEVPSMESHQEERSIGNPDIIVDRLLEYFSVKGKDLDSFAALAEDDIVHFRKIKFTGSAADYEKLKGRTKVIVKYPPSTHEGILEDLFKKQDLAGYKEYDSLFAASHSFSVEGARVRIRHLANHYYHPLLVSDSDKAEYLSHIVRVPSEVKFIEALEASPEAFGDFDWWMFSKLDETLDKVFIPYYDYRQNRFANFSPDFIFWMQKGKDYRILFVDPKGVQHSQYEHKAEGYAKLFGPVQGEHEFPLPEHDSIKVKVHLKFFTDDLAGVAEAYRPYWTDTIDGLLR